MRPGDGFVPELPEVMGGAGATHPREKKFDEAE